MRPRMMFLLVWLSALAVPAPASAVVPLSDYNALRNVSVVEEGEDLQIRFEFKKPLEQRLEPHFYKRSVQIDFLLTYVDPPKRYFPVYAGPVSQVYVSQFDPELMRVRVMLLKENAVRPGDLRMERNGRFLNLYIRSRPANRPDEALDRLLERAVAKTSHQSEKAREDAPPASLAAVEKVLSRVEAGKTAASKPENRRRASKSRTPLELRDGKRAGKQTAGNPSPSTATRKTTRTPGGESPTPGEDGLWGSALRMIATLAFVVGLMFLLFHGFKKYVLKQGMFGAGNQPIRVLSTGFLGPKKSIALVEVAGKVLVLGVANEHISLLSSLENPEEVDRLLRGGRENRKETVKESNNGTSVRTAPPAPSNSRGGVDVYTRRARPAPRPASQESDAFAEVVREFAQGTPKPRMSADTLRRLIRERLERTRAGV